MGNLFSQARIYFESPRLWRIARCVGVAVLMFIAIAIGFRSPDYREHYESPVYERLDLAADDVNSILLENYSISLEERAIEEMLFGGETYSDDDLVLEEGEEMFLAFFAQVAGQLQQVELANAQAVNLAWIREHLISEREHVLAAQEEDPTVELLVIITLLLGWWMLLTEKIRRCELAQENGNSALSC